jgi:hypothetical protein
MGVTIRLAWNQDGWTGFQRELANIGFEISGLGRNPGIVQEIAG